MAARSIPIDVVRAFVAVVEARGFTRAAEDLGRSQPTISLQVKRLEELIEAPLFEKVARFELTAVGSVCFDYGRRLLRLHDEMLDEAQRPQGARRPAPDRHAGRVRLAPHAAARPPAPGGGRDGGFRDRHGRVRDAGAGLSPERARRRLPRRRRDGGARGGPLARRARLVRLGRRAAAEAAEAGAARSSARGDRRCTRRRSAPCALRAVLSPLSARAPISPCAAPPSRPASGSRR